MQVASYVYATPYTVLLPSQLLCGEHLTEKIFSHENARLGVSDITVGLYVSVVFLLGFVDLSICCNGSQSVSLCRSRQRLIDEDAVINRHCAVVVGELRSRGT
jgi:hypothetical protein